MRHHLNFEHAPWDSPYPARTRYRVDALLQPCQVDGWVIESPHFGRNALRKGLFEVELPTIPWHGQAGRPWEHPASHFLQERFFVVLRAELGIDRDYRDPADDSWLPTSQGKAPASALLEEDLT